MIHILYDELSISSRVTFKSTLSETFSVFHDLSIY